ncbi:hypothetical protein AGMMS49991_11910 [Spirochaetia bacterium]|nr:hypothetical protein AGMMS49991_11910 [Spirochaetia bacterium]
MTRGLGESGINSRYGISGLRHAGIIPRLGQKETAPSIGTRSVSPKKFSAGVDPGNDHRIK